MSHATRKRRASWGSLSYDAKTKTARIRYWAEGADGYRRRSKTLRNVTRKQAEEARATLLLEHGDDAPCPTVAQVWERWVLPMYVRRSEDGTLSVSSLTLYKGIWSQHVAPVWGDVPCDQVRALNVQQWLMDGRTYTQAVKSKGLLSQILNQAVLYGVIPSNVATAKYVMPSKSDKRIVHDKGVWSLQELGKVWKHVHGSHIESAFLLSAFGSCRPGEALAVTVDDVTRRETDVGPIAVARIDKQVPNRGTELVHTLKNKQSVRHVVLVGRPAKQILEIAERSDWLLSSDGFGGAVTQTNLLRSWKRLVPEEIRHPFRNLRNSWQTNMRWELGVPPWLIEPMMGHAGKDVTGLHYDRPQVDVFCSTMESAYAEHPFDADWVWLD